LRPTGGGEHEERAEDLDSSQGVRDHLVAYHLAPAITDLISDEIRVCCNNDLEQKLMLLHSESSKQSNNVNGAKTQDAGIEHVYNSSLKLFDLEHPICVFVKVLQEKVRLDLWQAHSQKFRKQLAFFNYVMHISVNMLKPFAHSLLEIESWQVMIFGQLG